MDSFFGRIFCSVSCPGVDLLLLLDSFFCQDLAVVIGFGWLKRLVLSPMGVSRISVTIAALGSVEWVSLTSFAIVAKDRQQREAQRSSSTSCVGFYVQRNCRRWGLAFSNTRFEKSTLKSIAIVRPKCSCKCPFVSVGSFLLVYNILFNCLIKSSRTPWSM